MKCLIILLSFTLLSIPSFAQQWEEQDCGWTNQGIRYISVVDQNCAWATVRTNDPGSPGRFTRTSDGTTWTTGVVDASCVQCANFSSFWAISCDEAFAAISNSVDANVGGAIVHTMDGGQTWDTIASADFSEPTDFPNFIGFFDDMHGVCAGDVHDGYFKIYTTEDAGETWSRVPEASIPAVISNEAGYASQFEVRGNSVWFQTSLNRLFRSQDMGATWEAFNTPEFDGADVAFADEMRGLALNIGDTDSNIYKTTDGGKTWISAPRAVDTYVFDFVYAEGANGKPGAYVIGGLPGAYFSYNSGVSWNSIPNTHERVVSLDFKDIETGWASEPWDGNPGDGIFKYVGDVLSTEEIASQQETWSVFPNPSNGWLTVTSNQVNAEYILFDAQGARISNLNPNADGRLDMASFPAGIYVIQQRTLEGTTAIRVVLQ